MAIELDMAQYLDLFVQEAEEQLETLERELLLLEKEPTHERIDLVFRAAHTLKGSSRAMGFSNVAGLTHEMENVLDAVRGGTMPVTTTLSDALLACLDALRTMVDAIQEGRGDAWKDDGLVDRLRGFLKGPTPTLPPTEILPPEIEAALALAAAQSPVYRTTVVLTPDCVMKFVRAFMAIQAVGENGELLASIPDVAALEEEAFGSEFTLFFQTDDAIESVERRLRAVGEIERIEVAPYGAPTQSLPQGTPPADSLAHDSTTEVPSKVREAGATVRVDVSRLDELMNLVGELVIDRARIAQIGAALAGKYTLDSHLEALAETTGHLARIAADLQDGLMKTRMMPIETVFNRFPRMVRDLAQKLGKEVELDLVGGETELDRSVLETIGDPLIHILRNSIDHGLEHPEQRGDKPRLGRVVLSARHQENHIVIEITDDGRGIDAERLKAKAVAQGLISSDTAERMAEREALSLIFHSGFSTATQVSEVSGRGVGMDIVRSNLQKLGGLIDVETNLGEGTRFTLRLPLTLAIIRGLLVRVAGVVYVLPLGSVVETLRVERNQIQSVRSREVVVIRGETVPLVRLRRTFGRHGATDDPSADAAYVVVVGLADRRLGLVVDRLVGEQEVVIKSLNRFCGEVRGISGATILGDGNVALIVDVNGIVAEAAS